MRHLRPTRRPDGSAFSDRAARRRLPPRLLPLLYFASAHLALVTAFAVVAVDPRGVAGFFYHPRMLGVVHLVTLGWISGSILGALYVVGPMALRVAIPARAADYWAWALFTVGTIGMVAHFWLNTYSGMAWSGIMVATGFVIVAVRVLPAVLRAPIEPAVRLHVVLAFANLALAAVLGILMGFDRLWGFLPGYVLDRVSGHAHLATAGWAVMMVAGVGYRLLPMVLPSAKPPAATMFASALLLQAGVLGLTFTVFAGRAGRGAFAALIAAGVLAFLERVWWMARRCRRASPAFVGADEAVGHLRQALAVLLMTVAAGLVLVLSPVHRHTPALVMAYGVLALVGFLSRMIAGVQVRILPLFAWYWAFAETGFRGPLPAPPALVPRSWSRVSFWLWTTGVPVLTAGLALNVIPLVAAGAWLLFGAALAGGIVALTLARRAFGRVPLSELQDVLDIGKRQPVAREARAHHGPAQEPSRVPVD